jgi:hypothetical protein
MSKKSNSKAAAPTTPKVVVDKDSSVQVRQIMNGFIVSESGTTGKGRNQQYYNKEFFSKTNPLKMSGQNGNAPKMKFGGK